MNKRILGIAFVALGFLMMLSAIGLGAAYAKREAAAGQYSEMIMVEYKRHEQETLPLPIPSKAPEVQIEAAAEPEEIPEMATDDYFGLRMLGVLNVPDCGIELPVLDDWNFTILDYAPCRYTGSVFSDDMVIMGHNYTTHFKPLKKVEEGASVVFEAVDGKVWNYVVEEIDSIHRDEPEKLESEHELILFTCEEYGVYRFVARCRLIEE